MKILVPLKRVSDPDNANKIKITGSADRVDVSHLEWKINPFDEYALEAALRLTEDGKQPKKRMGEVVVVTLGPKETETTLRGALATGADRAVRVEATDDVLDGRIVAQVIKNLAMSETPDLILMGKQAVDGDSNFVGQAVAELLDWPMATFAATLRQQPDGKLVVAREVDGGLCTLELTLPAVVTVDLRIVAPESVYSKDTAPDFKYKDGVRFAPLPAIMAAKKKPLDVKDLASLCDGKSLSARYFDFQLPATRKAGVKVSTAAELVKRLSEEARVI